LLRSYIILGPKELRLRSDGSPPHPYLTKHLGIACKHCGFKTTSVQVVGRHLSKDHNVKRKSSMWLRDHVVEGLTLQSWDRNGTYGYWTVALDRSTMANSSFDNSLLQGSVPRLRRLEELHHNELERVAERQKATTTSTGSLDMAVNTNWMRRTGWNETFAGANRKLLVELVQMPRGRGQCINLGTYNDTVLCSGEEDEQKLALMVSALDRVFDRCEDTIRHTDVSIRCWLRGQYFDRPYKAPFELV
ncbi:hypothetical protein DM02DRAFT_507982, partial [Periconia macrospinosa]